MAKWESFEIGCAKYLNDRFGAYASFSRLGGPDSTVSDILVETKSGNSFYIDAKLSPAQCGQFVLLPNFDTRTFEYSHRNGNRINKYAKMIMDYMNGDFDEFIKAGTAGKDIDMQNGSDIFANWIILAYKNKGVDFFITNNYTILPIEHFKEYFDVTANYRIKRSGSANVGRSYIKCVKEYITSHDYDINNSRIDGDKLFVISPRQLHKQCFLLDGKQYMFSSRENEYELRKLSNTDNANVIFSICHNPTKPGLSDKDFINCLK